MGRKSKMKNLKSNKKASNKAKESEIKIPPPQNNENFFFKLQAEENSSEPAAEDYTESEINAEEKEMNLILQNLREELTSEQAKLKQIQNMQKDADQKIEEMEEMYENSNDKYTLVRKMKSALAISRSLIEKMKEGNEKVKSIVRQIKDVEIKYNEYKERIKEIYKYNEDERIKEINKLKKEIMENYEQIFENNKELTRSSETVMELEEAQTLCLFENRYQNATETIQANSSENIAKIMEVIPLCSSYYATQIFEQATDFETTKISEKKTLIINEPIVEEMKEFNEKTDHCEVHQAQQFKSVMRYHDLYMKTPEVNQVIIKNDEESVMNIVKFFTMELDLIESSLTSLENEVTPLEYIYELNHETINTLTSLENEETTLQPPNKEINDNINKIIKINKLHEEEKIIMKNLQVTRMKISECQKDLNFYKKTGNHQGQMIHKGNGVKKLPVVHQDHNHYKWETQLVKLVKCPAMIQARWMEGQCLDGLHTGKPRVKMKKNVHHKGQPK